MPEQCMAVLKPLGATHTYQCPAPAVPGKTYCPIHMVIEGRIKERARKSRSLLEFYRRKAIKGGW